jgi:hypothetical protein
MLRTPRCQSLNTGIQTSALPHMIMAAPIAINRNPVNITVSQVAYLGNIRTKDFADCPKPDRSRERECAAEMQRDRCG